MAIVVYRCDTCKREIELQRNTRGLETVGRCIITNGCRGHLYQTEVLEDFVRGRLPEGVIGLDDWQQRQVLYNHEQAIERDEWIIEHNLGTSVLVTVLVNRPTSADPDNQEEVIPDDIEIVTEDSLILRFERPFSGIAQLVARQTDPDLLRPFVREVPTVEPPLQLSNNGEISIATRITDQQTSIALQVRFDTTTESVVFTNYDADDQPSLDSAWSNADKVIIAGKVYTVRSFNGIIPSMLDGTIADGSTFQFISVDPSGTGSSFQAIQEDQIIILLATEPFGTVDKIRDRFIDVTSVTDDVNPTSFVYNSGEFSAETAIVETIYPLIRTI